MKILLNIFRKILELLIGQNDEKSNNKNGDNKNKGNGRKEKNNNSKVKKYEYTIGFNQLKGLKEIDKMTYKVKNIIKEDYPIVENGKVWRVI